MDKQTATNLVTQTFDATFDEQRFANFARNLFNQIDESKTFSQQGAYIWDAFKGHVRQYKRLGTYTDPEGTEIDVLIVRLEKETALDRARTMQRNFVARYLKERDEKDAALVAYYSDDQPDWRFSLVKMEYQIATSETTGRLKTEEILTPARRYSFLVGQNEPNHTAQQQLVPILQDTRHNPTLAQLEAAFNIESVTKEFFQKYKALFLDLKDELDRLAGKNKAVKAEFDRAGIDTTNFAKKLLGQIVFLYFLQKKGWLGVAQGQAWGSGPKDFLRRLFEGADAQRSEAGGLGGSPSNSSGEETASRLSRPDEFTGRVHYTNFFNDVLEPLFYEALAIERSGNLYPPLNCRIPFLNGGLFEPVGDYDWRGVDILLDNTRFRDIFETFDLFNFTVREDEPLEKEVAVDPEMLGKVFENLLEVTDRKSKGAFYTPREIVHYMCQESLINYLDTSLNASLPLGGTEGGQPLISPKAKQQKLFGDPDPEQLSLTVPSSPLQRGELEGGIPRADIDALIRTGEFGLEHDAAKAGGTKSYQYQLPPSIRDNAAAIDTALAGIKICDPAIGSGAFPVGLMQEVVKARTVLTTYLTESKARLENLESKARFGMPEQALDSEIHFGRTPYQFKRHAIQESIYGVDIDPGAVDIAKLRLWLSLVVDEESYDTIQPLPNLDYKIVCGNSLIGFPEKWHSPAFTNLEKLKRQYFSETDAKKKATLKKEVDSQIQERLAKSEKVFGYKVDFDFRLFFSEVFHQKNGFDVVIGNPPYINTNEMKELSKTYRRLYSTAYGSYDIYVIFFEVSKRIVKPDGLICFITSNKYLIADYGIKLRNLILSKFVTLKLIDLADCKRVFQGALVSPCITVIQNRKPVPEKSIEIAILKDDDVNRLPNVKFRQKTLESLASGENQIFDIHISEQTQNIINKLFVNSLTLDDISDVRTGVMGFNYWSLDEFVKDGEFRGGIRIATNGFIDRYKFSWGEKARLYKKDIYNPYLDIVNCPLNDNTKALFRKQKIIIRGVAKRLSANLDDEGIGLLVAVHSAVIQDTKNNHPKFVLSLLNSNLLNWYHVVKFYTARIPEGSLKYPISFLKSIPIKQVSRVNQQPLIDLVSRILETKKTNPAANTSALEAEIDQLVYHLYGLTAEEIAIVEGRE